MIMIVISMLITTIVGLIVAALSVGEMTPVFGLDVNNGYAANSTHTDTNNAGSSVIFIENSIMIGNMSHAHMMIMKNGMIERGNVAMEIGRASCREKCRSRWSPYH